MRNPRLTFSHFKRHVKSAPRNVGAGPRARTKSKPGPPPPLPTPRALTPRWGCATPGRRADNVAGWLPGAVRRKRTVPKLPGGQIGTSALADARGKAPCRSRRPEPSVLSGPEPGAENPLRQRYEGQVAARPRLCHRNHRQISAPRHSRCGTSFPPFCLALANESAIHSLYAYGNP